VVSLRPSGRGPKGHRRLLRQRPGPNAEPLPRGPGLLEEGRSAGEQVGVVPLGGEGGAMPSGRSRVLAAVP